tara:strand:- start:2857 stop:3483 length:627 start_codon:yes stop_codon:yes gene_type:complete
MKTKVKSYTDKQLLNKVKSLPNFKKIPKQRWILGVRSNEDTYDSFDDKFYEFEGEKFIRVLTGTTNAGSGVLRGGFLKYNKRGVAVLKADEWYYNVWSYGLHRGKMPSLKQTGRRVKVYRDGNKNRKSEELGEYELGWFGINYHTNTYDFRLANLKVVNWLIGYWSAGCQVINNRQEYVKQIDYYKNSFEKGTQIMVSYCLINEFDTD